MPVRAVFLDRDGVINRAIIRNRKPYPPDTLSQVEILPGVLEALQQLKSAEFLLLGVTNQPDVARGTQRKEVVESINSFLMDQLPLDGIYTCYHDNQDDCDCRKPKPGLLLQGGREFDIDLGQSFMVGDRWKDIAAGINAGCRTIWIRYDYDEEAPSPPADFTCSSLSAAVEWIIRGGF